MAADAEWRAKVQAEASARGTGGCKLRTYARFKTAVTQEGYLSTNMKTSARQLLCRFRIGVAPLQIELGRRQPGQGSRACEVCGAEAEDEEHFLMACPLYDELRGTLFEDISSLWQAAPARSHPPLQQWAQGTLAQRFDLIMASQGNDEVKALAGFMEQAWALRSAFLADPAVATPRHHAAATEAHAPFPPLHQHGDQQTDGLAVDYGDEELVLEP